MATWTEQAVGKLDTLIVFHELAEVVLCLHGLFHLGFGFCLFLGGADGLACQQLVGHGEENGIMVGVGPDLLIVRVGSLLVHGVIHVTGHIDHELRQLLFLDLFQHTVEIEVIQLQEQVGGDKAGELLVVVLLIDMEQLVVGGGNDGKAVLCQMLAEQGVELLQLLGIDEVTHVHAQILGGVEVLFLQLIHALLEPFHEVLFLLGVFDESFHLTGTVVEVAPRLVLLLFDAFEVGFFVELPHQGVVPRGTLIDTADIGILEGESLTGGGGVTEHEEVTDGQSGDIHVVVDTVFQLLHVDM